MCNGANLAYTKRFSKLNGFDGNDKKIASGTTSFFIAESNAAIPRRRVQYLSQNNIVTYWLLSDWKSFFIKESAGLQRNDFLSKCFQSFWVLLFLLGSICGFWQSGSGLQFTPIENLVVLSCKFSVDAV
jgi:hypothetical protein